jgi:small subunit ribosomal protein S1
MAEYGSSDSGASLGDILGAALTRAREEGDGDEEAPAVDAAPAAEAPVEEAAEEPAAEAPAAEAGDDELEKS